MNRLAAATTPLLLAAIGCGAPESAPTQPPTATDATPTVHEIESPAGDHAMAPHLSRTAAGDVYLSWLERDGDGHRLRFAHLEGDTWSAATTIHAGESFFANWADLPSLAALSDGGLLAHWLEKTPGGTYAYDVRYRRSSDGGVTWSEPFTLNDDGTATEHGFVSLAPIAGGEAVAVWLDGREMAGGDDHDHPVGAMTLRRATIATDGSVATSSVLDARVCECCNTAAVVSDEAVVAFYRDRSDDEVRDIAVVRATGAGGTPRRLHDDGWRIAGCPVNGPAADADGQRIAVAWYSNADERARVSYAFSTDAGDRFTAPIEVAGTETLGRVAIALLPDGSALVGWLEDGPETGTIRARRVTASGQLETPFTIAATSSARRSGFPQLTRAGDRVVVAWTDAGDPGKSPKGGAPLRVRTALLDLGTPLATD